MTTPLTPEDLEAIRQRAEAATPGPWHSEDGRDDVLPYLTVWPVGQPDDVPNDRRALGAPILIAHVIESRDQPFIAHAREDIPRLLAEIDRLREALGIAVDCLGGYVTDSRHSDWDVLTRAHAALHPEAHAAEEQQG